MLICQTTGKVENPAFDEKIISLLNFSVPVISVKDFVQIKDNCIILDAREKEEFELSHIPGAKFIGYNKPDYSILEDVEKDQTIIVYCSVGYRSEKVGEKISDKGFKKVYNLYGSIFEWANQGFKLENSKSKSTQKLHGYNKAWSKWVTNKNVNVEW